MKMPGIDDWKTRPYSIIQNIFDDNKDNSHDGFISQVEEYFTQRLNDESILKIPSLNNNAIEHLTPGGLVKYRCMVQDVFDPQFCLGQYVVQNKQTQNTRLECGSFRDIPNISLNETLDMDNRENKPVERQSFYCVPIPGEQEWVKQIYNKNSINTISTSVPTKSSESTKRKNDDVDDEYSIEEKNKPVVKASCEQGDGSPETEILQEHNAIHAENKPNCTSASTLAKNFPLPNESGTPCIVRVYSSKVELKTTDVVEFIGILSVDPALASVCDEMEGEELMSQEELRAHEPPPSLVPRIHAVLVRVLDHNNPHLPPVTSSDMYKSGVKNLMQDAGSIRMELHSILQHALLGDSLASEYLICHLLARVYARADAMPLGKMTLNLSGCPGTQRYSLLLNHLISQITSKHSFMEMTIENMNSWKLIPKKDYTANRVNAGMLQLSPGTQVVLDETALQQGQLDNTGVMNVRALEDVIAWQKVDYDFQWSTVTIQSDINVLILSECTSLLSKDIHVPMVTENVNDIPSHFTLLDKRLTEEILQKLRCFITACQHMTYEICDDVQKVIQEDFVEIRQVNPADMSVEDFQRLLTLLRLLTLSYGLEKSNLEIWRKAKKMEDERKARIARLPKPSNGTA